MFISFISYECKQAYWSHEQGPIYNDILNCKKVFIN